MQKGILQLKGLNCRNNGLNQNPQEASDMRNLVKNSRGEFESRLAMVKYDDMPTAIDSTNYPIDSFYYEKDDVMCIIANRGNIYTYDGSDWRTINIAGHSVTDFYRLSDVDKGESFAEYNNSVYYADPFGILPIRKFDGKAIYRAGVPAMTVNSVTPGSYWYRAYLSYRDANNNITIGQFVEFQADDTANITMDNPIYQSGFNQKGATKDGTPETVSSSNLTISVVSGHNYVSGDFINAYVTELGRSFYKNLEIESTTSTSITFTSASVGSAQVQFTASYPVVKSWVIELYKCDTQYGTYYKDSANDWHLDPSVAATTSFAPTAWASVTDTPMTYHYGDTTMSHKLPPRARYITMYLDLMIAAGDGDNSNETSGYSDNLVSWSSNKDGFNVETFTAYGQQPVGVSSEGPITGIFADSSVKVFKRRAAYYMTGDLDQLNYSVFKSALEGVGCVSHKTIGRFGGNCIFLSERGIYNIKENSQPNELSDSIEPLFTSDILNLDLNLEHSKITFDEKKERITFFIGNNSGDKIYAITYSYYFHEFYLLEYPSEYDFATKGAVNIYGDKLVICSGSAIDGAHRMVIEDDTAVADVVGTDTENLSSYWWSGWDCRGNPSLESEFINLMVFSLSDKEFNCIVKNQENWIETDVMNENKDFSTSDQYRLFNIDNNMCKSMRFYIGNSSGEKFKISGIIYDVEDTQKRMKR